MNKPYKVGAIVLFLVGLLVFVRLYGGKKNHCSDAWNKTMLKVELRVCFWNAMHVLFFLGICVFLEPRSLVEHLIIFGIGVLWYAMQVLATDVWGGEVPMAEPKPQGPEASYSDLLRPKLDDFVYNSLGQVIFVFTTLPFFAAND